MTGKLERLFEFAYSDENLSAAEIEGILHEYGYEVAACDYCNMLIVGSLGFHLESCPKHIKDKCFMCKYSAHIKIISGKEPGEGE